MSLAASLKIDPDVVIAPVNERIFGGFVEHMGRCVYTGIFEPGHETATEDGLRADVMSLTKALGIRAVRYPGGNFASGYQWEDGVGPKSVRPKRLDLAWGALEPNSFGLDEFQRWAHELGAETIGLPSSTWALEPGEQRQRLSGAGGRALPVIPTGFEAEIDFQAGFGPTPDDVPGELSQAVLTSVLNTSLSTVYQRESGEKRPSGPSLELLNLLDRKGLEALI